MKSSVAQEKALIQVGELKLVFFWKSLLLLFFLKVPTALELNYVSLT